MISASTVALRAMVDRRDDNHARCDWIPDNRAKGAISGMTLVEVFPSLSLPLRTLRTLRETELIAFIVNWIASVVAL